MRLGTGGRVLRLLDGRDGLICLWIRDVMIFYDLELGVIYRFACNGILGRVSMMFS